MSVLYEKMTALADAIREKTGETKKLSIDGMTEAVNGLEPGSGADLAKFGIGNEVTGTGIVTCDYVNENEHDVRVKLSSDTVTDFSGVEVKCIGKNLIDFNKPYDISGSYYSWLVPKKENDFFTVSLIDKGNDYDVTGLYLGVTTNGINHSDGVVWLLESGVVKKSTYYTKQDAHKLFRYISTYGNDKADVIKKIMNRFYIQVEISEYPTSYEPYTEKTYTSNADGTVDGVTSIAPIMNIICDTEGVGISAKYYQCPTAEYDRFWDSFQKFGNRTNYINGFFGEGWKNDNFKPKYDIIPEGYMVGIFRDSKITTDLVDIFNQNGIVFDTKKVARFNEAFAYASFTRIGVLDVSGVENGHSFQSTFYGSKIKTIDKIVSTKTLNGFSSSFNDCSQLENITFEAEIGGSINLQWSKLLTVESAKNIIQCLANYAGTDNAGKYTLTLSSDTWALLEAEGNTSPSGGLWVDYVTEIGWNWS